MFEKMIAVGIAVAIAVGLLLWVPFLEFVCPRCGRFLARTVRGTRRPLAGKDEVRREAA